MMVFVEVEKIESIAPSIAKIIARKSTRPLKPFSPPKRSPKKPPNVLAKIFMRANDKTKFPAVDLLRPKVFCR